MKTNIKGELRESVIFISHELEEVFSIEMYFEIQLKYSYYM